MTASRCVRFSRRLAWGTQENALARAEAERQASGLPFFDLTLSNPTLAELPYPVHAIAQSFADPAMATYQPSPRGLAQARAAVAADYARRGARVDADAIMLTASSSESYALLFKLLGDPGQAVLVPEPSYPLFDYLAALEGLVTRTYRLAFDGRWHIDFPSLDFANVAALVVVSPNNPTGSYISAEDCHRLAELTALHGVALIADEVFADFPLAPSTDAVTAISGRQLPSLTFSLGGLSKASGLPQMKLGWIAATGPRSLVEPALANLDLVADTYLSVGAPVQLALPRLLERGGGYSPSHPNPRRAQSSRARQRNRCALALHVAAGGGGLVRHRARAGNHERRGMGAAPRAR